MIAEERGECINCGVNECPLDEFICQSCFEKRNESEEGQGVEKRASEEEDKEEEPQFVIEEEEEVGADEEQGIEILDDSVSSSSDGSNANSKPAATEKTTLADVEEEEQAIMCSECELPIDKQDDESCRRDWCVMCKRPVHNECGDVYCIDFDADEALREQGKIDDDDEEVRTVNVLEWTYDGRKTALLKKIKKDKFVSGDTICSECLFSLPYMRVTKHYQKFQNDRTKLIEQQQQKTQADDTIDKQVTDVVVAAYTTPLLHEMLYTLNKNSMREPILQPRKQRQQLDWKC